MNVRAVGRRAGWVLADQAASSLTNFVLSYIVLRTLSLGGFGVFAIAYSTYKLVTNAVRSLAGDPLVIRFSAADPAAHRRAASESAATAAMLGAAAGLVVIAGAMVLASGSLRETLVVLAVTLPGLMLQDTYRFAFFAAGQPAQAFWNDALWGVLQLAAVAAVIVVVDTPVVAVFVLVWGVTGGLAGLVAAAQARAFPRFSVGTAWLRSHRGIGSRLLGGATLAKGAAQATDYLIGGVAGVVALGTIAGARLLLGPLNVLYLGVGPFGVSEGVRLLARDAGRFRRAIYWAAIGLGAAALVLGAAWLLVPASVGQRVIPNDWAEVRRFLPVVMAIIIARGVTHGFQIGIKALGAATDYLRATGLSAPLLVLGAGVGAFVGGGMGAAVGLAAARLLEAAIWIHRFGGAFANRPASTAGSVPSG